MTLRGPALFCSLGLLWLFAGLAKASDPKVPKLVWAHYVGWGFDFRKFYENPVQHYLRLQDRPLLGPWVDTDIGASSTVRLEMECALRYGVNGFAVDILKVQAYRHAMRRFYQGAEGLPFYVALCVDGWGNASMEEVVDALTAYFEEWGDHPNNFYIDGKPVVFIYKVGRPLADCREIVQRVRGRGFDAYWLVQPERETTLWENEPRMDEALSIFDGLYDFGINGFSVEEMKRRLVNGRRGLMKSRPGGLLVAGITPGYVGSKNAFYRPAYGTRTLRDNWAAAIFAAADWVCLTTWNDFWENTQFVPSEWNRDSLLRVNQIHSRRWRGEEQVPAPPDAILSYKPEVRLGDPWEVEVLGLPHIGGKATCAVELLDETGATMRRLPDVEMAGEGSVTVRHLPPSDLESHRLLRLRVAIVPKGSKVRREDWRELYPVAIRVGTMRKVQTIRFPVSAITEKVTISREGSSVLARIQSPNWVGEAALLRNGEVVERIPVAHSGGRMGNVSFDLGHISAQLPVDDFVVRFTRADGRLGFSPPIRVESQKQSSVFATKVAWRPLAMDVAWGNAAARCAGVRTVSLPREDVYGFRFEFNDPVADAPRDDFGWHVASMGGARSGDRRKTGRNLRLCVKCGRTGGFGIFTASMGLARGSHSHLGRSPTILSRARWFSVLLTKTPVARFSPIKTRLSILGFQSTVDRISSEGR